MTPEILPSAIETICARFKKAADIYCQKYPRHGISAPGFEAAVSSYERHKRHFNNAVQDWIKVHGALPEWARGAVIYQMEHGFLDKLWLTWDEGAAIPWARAKEIIKEPKDGTLLADFVPCDSCNAVIPASAFGFKLGDTVPNGTIFRCNPCANERRTQDVNEKEMPAQT